MIQFKIEKTSNEEYSSTNKQDEIKENCIDELSNEIIIKILSELPMSSIISFSMTCKKFRAIAQSDILWKPLYQICFPSNQATNVSVITNRWGNEISAVYDKQGDHWHEVPCSNSLRMLAMTPAPYINTDKDFLEHIQNNKKRVAELMGSNWLNGEINQCYQTLENALIQPRTKLLKIWNQTLKANETFINLHELNDLIFDKNNIFYCKRDSRSKFIPIEEIFLMHSQSLQNSCEIITFCDSFIPGHTFNCLNLFFKIDDVEIINARKNYNLLDAELHAIAEFDENGNFICNNSMLCALHLSQSPNELKFSSSISN